MLKGIMFHLLFLSFFFSVKSKGRQIDLTLFKHELYCVKNKYERRIILWVREPPNMVKYNSNV